MPVSLLAEFGYGGYVSPIKLGVYLVFFVLWFLLVNWVYADTQAVRTKVRFWISLVSASGALSLVVWLFAPFFLIGLLICVVAVGATNLAYAMHRNSLVSDAETVLTPDHFKRIFSREGKRVEKSTVGISFITANNNDVPLPPAKTEESYAYQEACEIFEDAVWRRVSQLSMMPGAEEYSLSYVIDGKLTKQPGRDREDVEQVVYLLKQIADLDTKEKRKPQTGRLYSVVHGTKVAWDLATAGSSAGEQVRLVRYEDKELMSLDDIGLDADQVEALKPLRQRSSGLFLTTAPAKEGVTTTFYALMKNHDPFMNDINTYEKKVTGTLDNVTQQAFSMNDSSGGSYVDQFQTIVRMGSNIIGISDCEDPEAAKIATDAAANQNRMIHVSFEATSTIKALAKWIKLVGEKNMIVDSLVGITNQRLARRLCDECKQPYKPNPKLLKRFHLSPEKAKMFFRQGDIEYDKNGKPMLCEKCQGTGYYGITGIYETIVIDDELREMLKASKTMKDVARAFARANVVTIQDRALQKVIAGVTSINEVVNELAPKAAAKPAVKKKAATKAKPQAKPEEK